MLKLSLEILCVYSVEFENSKHINKIFDTQLWFTHYYHFPKNETKKFWGVKRVSFVADKAGCIELLD